jgi:hypothetical protein
MVADPCTEGEGDCNSNEECKGMLECGSDNCAQFPGTWGSEDNCCERRCTEDRPCGQGKVGV